MQWLVLKQAVQGVTGTKRIIEVLGDARLNEALVAIGDNHSATAARALREARTRDGEATRAKLETARHALEEAYTAYARITMVDTWRARFYRMTHRSRVNTAYAICCQIALTAAIVYRELGNDEESVRDFLARAQRMGDLYQGRYEDFRRSTTEIPGKTEREVVLGEVYNAGTGTGMLVVTGFEDVPVVVYESHAVWREVIAEVERILNTPQPTDEVLTRIGNIRPGSPLAEGRMPCDPS
ncbi:hypothetical protein [Dactylosporangium darangshiense]|uniref:hypothetical protein n=1 Tax=Dactylosporangium darangshiense TaxID=579108 RepID=UPI0031F123B5